jgi:transposase-like protein
MTPATPKVKCPNCGSSRVEALLRQAATVYSEHMVVGILDGKLVLKERPLRKWDETDGYSCLDEELKCRACNTDFDLEGTGVRSEDDFRLEPKNPHG